MFLHALHVSEMVEGTEAERKLIAFLFENYTKEVRPVDRHNETLCLEFGVSISQLHEVVSTPHL